MTIGFWTVVKVWLAWTLGPILILLSIVVLYVAVALPIELYKNRRRIK